jgi:arylsulfatase A-like enzyme
MPRPRNYRLAALSGVILILLGACRAPSQLQDDPDQRPNFLIIISDDQRYDTMEYMPEVKARIFDEGVTFSNAYVTTPLCCPSRYTMFTGLYARHHGIKNNVDYVERPTVIQGLHARGYYTGIVGKYLNSYPISKKDQPLPEFDYWAQLVRRINRCQNLITG